MLSVGGRNRGFDGRFNLLGQRHGAMALAPRNGEVDVQAFAPGDALGGFEIQRADGQSPAEHPVTIARLFDFFQGQLDLHDVRIAEEARLFEFHGDGVAIEVQNAA